MNKFYDQVVLQIYYSQETSQLLEKSKLPINQADFEKLTSIAQQGGMDAQYALYEMYFRGNPSFVNKNNEIAFKWCMSAAKQGHGLAQWRVGYLYYMGIGTEKDVDESEIWYKKACDTYTLPVQKGDPVAQCILGQIKEDEYVEKIGANIQSQNSEVKNLSTAPDGNTTPSFPSSITAKDYQETKLLAQAVEEERIASELCDKLFAENPDLQKALKKANSSTMFTVSILIAVVSLLVGLLPIGILVIIIAYITKKQRNKKYEELFYATASDELKAAWQARYEAQERVSQLREEFKKH